jgi:hypothetical protein
MAGEPRQARQPFQPVSMGRQDCQRAGPFPDVARIFQDDGQRQDRNLLTGNAVAFVASAVLGYLEI